MQVYNLVYKFAGGPLQRTNRESKLACTLVCTKLVHSFCAVLMLTIVAGCSGEGDVKLPASYYFVFLYILVCYHHVFLLEDEDDLRDVRSAVADLAGGWMNLGISLGVRKGDLDTILSANPRFPSDSLREMLTLWLRKSYNVRTTFIFHPLCYIYYTSLINKFMVGEISHTLK